MVRPISRTALLALVALALFAFAGAASAKEKKPVDVKSACQERVHKKIKEQHAFAKDIQITQSKDWQPSSVQTGLGGTGTFTSKNKDSWTFEWTCVHDSKKNKFEVTVNYGKPTKPEKTKK